VIFGYAHLISIGHLMVPIGDPLGGSGFVGRGKVSLLGCWQ